MGFFNSVLLGASTGLGEVLDEKRQAKMERDKYRANLADQINYKTKLDEAEYSIKQQRIEEQLQALGANVPEGYADALKLAEGDHEKASKILQERRYEQAYSQLPPEEQQRAALAGNSYGSVMSAELRAGRGAKEPKPELMVDEKGFTWSLTPEEINERAKNGIRVSKPGGKSGTGLKGGVTAGVQQVYAKDLSKLREASSKGMEFRSQINITRQAVNSYAGQLGAGGDIYAAADKILQGTLPGDTATAKIIQNYQLESRAKRIEQTKGAVSDFETKSYDAAAPSLETSIDGVNDLLNIDEAVAKRAEVRSLFFEDYAINNGGELLGAQKAWNTFINENPIIDFNKKTNRVNIKLENIDNYDAYLPNASKRESNENSTDPDIKAALEAEDTGEVRANNYTEAEGWQEDMPDPALHKDGSLEDDDGNIYVSDGIQWVKQ